MGKGLTKEYWDAQAIAEKGHSKVMNRGWQPHHQQKMHNEQVAAIEALNIISGNSVLDIGCGKWARSQCHTEILRKKIWPY